jgi:general secretion pathway protein J
MTHARLDYRHGFTLVELLVALFITAIMFAMGYGAINQGLNDREAMRARQERLAALQNTMRILSQDFTQLAPRPVREPVGDTMQPALRAVAGGPSLITFTRAGWANPAGIQRSQLERVAYALQDGTLKRMHLPVLDATLEQPFLTRDLLTQVRSASFRYRDAQEWRDTWPPAASGNTPAILDTNRRRRPLAVEVTLDLEDWGRIVRIIEVPQ